MRVESFPAGPPAASHRPGRWLALLLFVVALIPRLPGLRRVLTTDESYFIRTAGSEVVTAFLRGDFDQTYWHFYPGVTLSWLESLGLAGRYLQQWLAGATLPPFSEYVYSDVLNLLVAARLPFVLLTALAVPAVYLLARRLLPEPVAFLGSLFLAFDPFFLAHSRVVHGDGPVTVFMSLSALAFFIYLRQPSADRPLWRDPYLLASALWGSLAALTKAPGQFMALFVVALSLLAAGLAWRQDRPLRPWLAGIVVWGLASLAVFVLLWPAMWVDPLGTLGRMAQETVGKVEAGHLVYFFGRPTLDPGPWFYPYVIPFRLTPVTSLGCLLALLWLVPRLNLFDRPGSGLFSPLRLLWLFVISLLLFGSLSPKKQDRYLLPLFPFLDLLAAFGWLGLLRWLYYGLLNGRWPIVLRAVILGLRPAVWLPLVLILFQFLPVVSYYPYYLTYFNPLMGGPRRAAETTLMGWGEGMEQVAAYLNARPNAEALYVATTPSQTLLPYFAGTGENFYTNDIAFRADYVVLYLSQMQRLAPSPEIVRYFQAQPPEQVVTIKGVTYAKIYPTHPRILADIPPQATPLNLGLGDQLRLAGYQLDRSDPAQPVLTLYWHALAPLSLDYTISLRARSQAGELLAQQDQWPIEGLLPTSQWRQGDYVADRHILPLSPDQAARLDHFEIVVYQAESGQTLGPPLTLPAE